MGTSAAHADAFYREVTECRHVYSVRDDDGFPSPITPSGARAMPFWSSASRARRIIESVAAYDGMRVVELELDVWITKWLPGLRGDGLLVGLNWSGTNATGYDLFADDVLSNLEARTKGSPRLPQ